MESKRIRRSAPQRTQAIRNTAKAFRQPVLWPDGGEFEAADVPPPPDEGYAADVVGRGVREGYRVIQEQIRRGQRIAQEIGGQDESEPARAHTRRPRPAARGGPRSGRRPGVRLDSGLRLFEAQVHRTRRTLEEVAGELTSSRPDLLRLAEIVLSAYVEAAADVARLGFDALGSLAPGWARELADDAEEWFEDLEELVAEPWQWTPGPSCPTTITSTVPIPVVVWSRRPVRIDFDLVPGCQSSQLAIDTLSPRDPDKPPLLDVDFVPVLNGPTLLRIRVDDDQPADTYRGQVFDQASGDSVGQLTVGIGLDLPRPRR